MDLTANDTDPLPDDNLDPTTTTIVTQPTNGTLTNNADGTVTYTPNPGYNGTDTFIYQVCDEDGLCDIAV